MIGILTVFVVDFLRAFFRFTTRTLNARRQPMPDRACAYA
jgi:hypothetical protein